MFHRPHQPALWPFALACGVVLCFGLHVIAEDESSSAGPADSSASEEFTPLLTAIVKLEMESESLALHHQRLYERIPELEQGLRDGDESAAQKMFAVRLKIKQFEVEDRLRHAQLKRLHDKLQAKIKVAAETVVSKVEQPAKQCDVPAHAAAIPIIGPCSAVAHLGFDSENTPKSALVIEADQPHAKIVISHGDMLIESQRIVLNDKCPNERVCCAEGKTAAAADDAESYTFSVSGPIRLEDDDSSETIAKALRRIPYFSRFYKKTAPVGVAILSECASEACTEEPLPRTIKTWDDLAARTGHAHAPDQEVCDADGESNCPAAETVENLLGRGSNVPLECQLPNVRHRLAARGHKLYISRSKQNVGVPVTGKNGERFFKRVDGPDIVQISTDPFSPEATREGRHLNTLDLTLSDGTKFRLTVPDEPRISDELARLKIEFERNREKIAFWERKDRSEAAEQHRHIEAHLTAKLSELRQTQVKNLLSHIETGLNRCLAAPEVHFHPSRPLQTEIGADDNGGVSMRVSVRESDEPPAVVGLGATAPLEWPERPASQPQKDEETLRLDYFRHRNIQNETLKQAHHLASAANELQQAGDKELAATLRNKAEHHKAQAEQLQFATQAKLRAWREHQAAASQPVSVRDDHSPSELPAVINDLRREIRELRAEMLELREELKEAQNGGESVSRKERSRSEMVVEQYMGGVPILDGVPYITRHFKGPGTYYRAEPKLPVRMSGVEYSGDFLDPKTKERRRAVEELRTRFDDIIKIAENLKEEGESDFEQAVLKSAYQLQQVIQEEQSSIAKSQREHVKAVEAKITGKTGNNAISQSEFANPPHSDFTQKLQQMMGRPKSQTFVFDLAAPASHFEMTFDPLNQPPDLAEGFTAKIPRLDFTPAALDIDVGERNQSTFWSHIGLTR